MAKTFKIVYDRKGCTGAGACVSACPENWNMGPDNKANVKKTKISEAEFKANMEAAKACPVNVIHIEDEKGKKLI